MRSGLHSKKLLQTVFISFFLFMIRDIKRVPKLKSIDQFPDFILQLTNPALIRNLVYNDHNTKF
jgi:hypothetical protein